MIIIYVFSIVCVHQVGALESSTTVPNDQFLKSFRQGLEKAEAQSAYVQLSGELTRSARTVGRSPTTVKSSSEPNGEMNEKSSSVARHINYLRSGAYQLLEYDLTPPAGGDPVSKPFRRCLIVGPEGEWSLRRDEDTKAFSIEMNSLPRSYRNLLIDHAKVTADAPFSIAKHRLLELFSSRYMKITKTESIEADNEKLIKCYFEYAPPPTSPGARGKVVHDLSNQSTDFKLTGWVAVSPQLGWLVRQFDVVFSGLKPGDVRTLHASGEVEYSLSGGRSVPTSTDLISTFSQGVTTEYHFRASEWSYDKPPTEKFMLAAYNLQDFAKSQPRPTARNGWVLPLLWTALGALAAACLFVISRRLRRSEPFVSRASE